MPSTRSAAVCTSDSTASYPAERTAFSNCVRNSAASAPPSARTSAVAMLVISETEASSTPGTASSALRTRPTQDPQVIPPTEKRTVARGCGAKESISIIRRGSSLRGMFAASRTRKPTATTAAAMLDQLTVSGCASTVSAPVSRESETASTPGSLRTASDTQHTQRWQRMSSTESSNAAAVASRSSERTTAGAAASRWSGRSGGSSSGVGSISALTMPLSMSSSSRVATALKPVRSTAAIISATLTRSDV
mmetsp:Transcript_44401/g.109987  ORF Transcript_44401/g.109987 Transcript_44401/m.109987 type:complete len:250 (-) Transcript_44401:221-970(-)